MLDVWWIEENEYAKWDTSEANEKNRESDARLFILHAHKTTIVIPLLRLPIPCSFRGTIYIVVWIIHVTLCIEEENNDFNGAN